MRMTIDIPERSVNRAAEAVPAYQVDPQTGLGVFRSGRPVTLDDVKAFEEDDGSQKA